MKNIPGELRELPYWLVYRREPKPDKFTPFGQPKTDKIPLQPRAPYRNASVANPEHVGPFEQARAALDNGSGADGVGFAVSMADETLIGIDVDGIIDPLLGDVAEHGQAAWELAQELNTYTEYSPSGEGLRMFVRSRLPKGFTSAHVEVYVGGGPSRFLTVTGDAVPGFPCEVREIEAGALEALLEPFRPTSNEGAKEPLESPQELSGAIPKDAPAPAEGLPTVESLNLAPDLAELLRPEGDGDAAFGRFDGDRSRAVHALTNALVLRTRLEPEVILGLLMSSGPVLDMALDHRRQDHDRAQQYLWDGIRKVYGSPEARTRREFLFPDDLSDEDTGGSQTGTSRKPPAWNELQIRADEFESASLAPPVIVDGYLYADLAVLIAPGGVGKTTLTLHEAIHIATGRPLYGRTVATPGRVLFVTAEDARERLVARLRQIMAALFLSPEEQALVLARIAIWDVSGIGLKLTQDKDGNLVPSELASLIVGAYRSDPPVLIVFDPLISFGTAESRVNDNEQALVSAARMIIRGLGCCVRYIHHTGKVNAREGTTDQYSSRGGTALPDGARMVHTLRPWKPGPGSHPPAEIRPDEDSQIIQIHTGKLSYAPPDAARTIWLQRRGFAYTWAAETARTPADRTRDGAQQVLDFLHDEIEQGARHTKNSIEDHRDELLLSRQQIRKALNWLVTRGLVIECDLPPDEKRGGRKTYLHPEARRIDDSTSPTAFGEVEPGNVPGGAQ